MKWGRSEKIPASPRSTPRDTPAPAPREEPVAQERPETIAEIEEIGKCPVDSRVVERLKALQSDPRYKDCKDQVAREVRVLNYVLEKSGFHPEDIACLLLERMRDDDGFNGPHRSIKEVVSSRDQRLRPGAKEEERKGFAEEFWASFDDRLLACSPRQRSELNVSESATRDARIKDWVLADVTDKDKTDLRTELYRDVINARQGRLTDEMIELGLMESREESVKWWRGWKGRLTQKGLEGLVIALGIGGGVISAPLLGPAGLIGFSVAAGLANTLIHEATTEARNRQTTEEGSSFVFGATAVGVGLAIVSILTGQWIAGAVSSVAGYLPWNWRLFR